MNPELIAGVIVIGAVLLPIIVLSIEIYNFEVNEMKEKTMTFDELLSNNSNLKEEAVKEKFKKALETVLECYDSIPPEEIVWALENGDFNIFSVWENDDMFGTEGMKL